MAADNSIATRCWRAKTLHVCQWMPPWHGLAQQLARRASSMQLRHRLFLVPQQGTAVDTERLMILMSQMGATALVLLAGLTPMIATTAMCLHLAMLLLIASVMVPPLTWTRQTDASANAQGAILAPAAGCLHRAPLSIAQAMALCPMTVTELMAATAPFVLVATRTLQIETLLWTLVALCLRHAQIRLQVQLADPSRIITMPIQQMMISSLVIATVTAPPLIRTGQMAAIVCALPISGLLMTRVATPTPAVTALSLQCAPTTIVQATALRLSTATELMAATAFALVGTLATPAQCLRRVWLGQLAPATPTISMPIQQMMIMSVVIAMVMARQTIWTGLMDAIVTVQMTTPDATALSHLYLVTSLVWEHGAMMIPLMASVVRQLIIAWSDISGSKKVEMSAALRVIQTLCASVTARSRARGARSIVTFTPQQLVQQSLQVSLTSREKKTTEVLTPTLRLEMELPMYSAFVCIILRLIS